MKQKQTNKQTYKGSNETDNNYNNNNIRYILENDSGE
jgi:hypothetical protein